MSPTKSTKTEMGLLNGELNLLMENLGFDDDGKELKSKDKWKNRDNNSLFAFSNLKSGEGTNDISQFSDSTNGIFGVSKNTEPMKISENYSNQVIELINTKNPIQKRKLRENLDVQRDVKTKIEPDGVDSIKYNAPIVQRKRDGHRKRVPNEVNITNGNKIDIQYQSGAKLEVHHS